MDSIVLRVLLAAVSESERGKPKVNMNRLLVVMTHTRKSLHNGINIVRWNIRRSKNKRIVSFPHPPIRLPSIHSRLSINILLKRALTTKQCVFQTAKFMFRNILSFLRSYYTRSRHSSQHFADVLLRFHLKCFHCGLWSVIGDILIFFLIFFNSPAKWKHQPPLQQRN